MFRIFDKSVGQMSYRTCINTLGNEIVVQAYLCDDIQTFTGDKLHDLIIMPMFNLQDKNGKYIFEYDIVKTHIGNFYIKWCNECKSYQCFYNSDEFGETCYACEGDFLWCEFVEELNDGDVEVIGNMFEHPERLCDD